MKNWSLTSAVALTAFVGIGFAVAPSSAQAQNLVSARGTVFGSGSYTLNNNTRRLTNANLALESNSRFTFTFTPRGGRSLSYEGRWRSSGNRAVLLQLERGPNDQEVTGSGNIGFSQRGGRWEPNSVRFYGRNERNDRRPFSLNMNVSRVVGYTSNWDSGWGGGSGSGNWSELITSRSGTGNIYVRGWGNDTRIRNVSAKLYRGGRAVLDFEGERNWSFEGSWRRISNDRVSLNITSGSSWSRGSSRWSGNGEIRLRNNQITSISADGRVGADPFNIRFTESGSGGGGGILPPDGSLEFRATRNGNGTIELNNRLFDNRVRTTIVELYRGGRAIITTTGQRNVRFEGTWRPGANRAVNFNITSVSGIGISGFTRISGDMIRENDKFSNLRLSGNAGGETLRFSFVGN